jgi:hypothetical protein
MVYMVMVVLAEQALICSCSGELLEAQLWLAALELPNAFHQYAVHYRGGVGTCLCSFEASTCCTCA